MVLFYFIFFLFVVRLFPYMIKEIQRLSNAHFSALLYPHLSFFLFFSDRWFQCRNLIHGILAGPGYIDAEEYKLPTN